MTRSIEQLESFFDEIFTQLPTASPSQISDLMFRAEMAFRQSGYRDEISAGVENILVVRLDVVGDMILTSGFLRELRKNFPRARITLVVSPFVFPIVELCPYVNEVLSLDPKNFAGKFADIFGRLVDFCRKNFWRKRLSLAFSPQWGSDNLLALILCWLSGARERIGYGTNPYKSWSDEITAEEAAQDNFLLTQNIITPRSVVSEVEKHFYLLEAVGLRVEETHMELFFSTEDFRRASELLQTVSPNCKKVLLGIGAGLPRRKYPAEKFLVALKTLAKKNLVFVIVGGKAELSDAELIERNLPHGKVLNLVGKTTLRETEAVISKMDFYIGNDSGVMHMAAAAQVPVLAIYRDAQDKEDYLPGLFSEFRKFPPWQTNFVVLRPDHQLSECAKFPPIYGWCHSDKPHCIAQIDPQEIVDGFEALEELT